MFPELFLLNFILFFQFLFYIHGCFACMFVYNCAGCPWRPEEGTRLPETGVIDSCEPPRGCWEPNLVPLEEWQVMLNVGPSLSP